MEGRAATPAHFSAIIKCLLTTHTSNSKQPNVFMIDFLFLPVATEGKTVKMRIWVAGVALLLAGFFVVHGDFRLDGRFVGGKPLEIARTEYGSIKAVSLRIPPIMEYSILAGRVHVFSITLGPHSMLLPMLFSRDFVLFVHTGRARLGTVTDNELVERDLKLGDIYRIPAGTAFQCLNTHSAERFRIIGILALHSKNPVHFIEEEQSVPQVFLFGGGLQAGPVLAGFDEILLEGAFKVSREELRGFMGKMKGPIVQLPGNRIRDLMSGMKKTYLSFITDPSNAMSTLVSKWKNTKMEKPYNLVDKKPNFKNNYGWTKLVSRNEYTPLQHPDVSVFLVNLTRGCMMAPHMNPRASEIAIVRSGSGIIQLVYPNGTYARSFTVMEGDVFIVPRYYLMSQLAAGDGHFEFVGFSTYGGDNKPEFHVGRNSIMNTMDRKTLVSVMRVDPRYLDTILNAQKDSVVYPCQGCAAALQSRVKKEEEERKRREKKEEEPGTGRDKERRKKEREEQIAEEEAKTRRRRRREEEEQEVRSKEEERHAEQEQQLMLMSKRKEQGDDGHDDTETAMNVRLRRLSPCTV